MRTVDISICFDELFYDVIHVKVEDNISVPPNKNILELVMGLVVKHKIPEFAIGKFRTYVLEVIDDEYHRLQSLLIAETMSSITDYSLYIDTIKNYYHETWSDFQTHMAQSDFEIFGNAYLRLVESGTDGMDAISRLELQFSRAMSEKIAHRNLVITNVDQKYMSSMHELEESCGINRAADINRLEQQYHQNRVQMQINWNSDISALREEQRRDFREFIMNAYSALVLGSPASSRDGVQSAGSNQGREVVAKVVDTGGGFEELDEDRKKKIPRSKSSMTILSKLAELNILRSQSPVTNSRPSRTSQGLIPTSTDQLPWQESFTIHLGRQMRSTHNMRIISVDPLDMLTFSSTDTGNKNKCDIESEEIASRLSTALNLYSRSLTAIVLLVDNRLNTYTGMKNKFASLCERSTDFHFPQLDQQLEEIKRTIGDTTDQTTNKGSKLMDIGDVYVTCHSNLNVVEVVFHLVIDDATIQKEIRFPSSIHNAIRNILRACFLHDIFCLNIPLLLSHTLKEYMTPAWCIRRVETILKAVKGAMMELCTWRGRESRTIQFLVPPGLSDDMLTSFSGLLTDYFQLSKAVKK